MNTTKTTVKKATRAKAKVKHEPELDKYVNATDQNVFTTQGRLKPTETIMLTSTEASQYIGLTIV